jgi:hypothetical protein
MRQASDEPPPTVADGLNLGLTRMAEACSVATLGQLAWTSDWHIREETYALALQRLVNQQQREAFSTRCAFRVDMFYVPSVPGRCGRGLFSSAATPIASRPPPPKTSPTPSRSRCASTAATRLDRQFA